MDVVYNLLRGPKLERKQIWVAHDFKRGYLKEQGPVNEGDELTVSESMKETEQDMRSETF